MTSLTTDLTSPEELRLNVLHDYDVLDTEPEAPFDDLTAIAAQICGTPIALISLVDADRQWFKSRIGLELSETPRRIAFCDHAIREPERVTMVPDARRDPRFADNPLVVGPPAIRFYAGAPLVTPGGHAIGTLCVIDRMPRQLDGEQLRALKALSRQVVSQLELKARVQQLDALVEAHEATQGQLRVSRERYSTIVDSAHDIIYRTDDRGYFSMVNAAAVRLLGYRHDELIGMRFSDLVREDHRFKVARFYTRQWRDRVLNTYLEFPALASDGNTVWLGQNVQLVEEGHDHIAFQAVARDITERRRMEEALAASEAKYRDLVDHAHDLIQSIGVDGEILFINRAWRELLGYSDDELSSMTIFDVVHPTRREEYRRTRDRIMQTGESDWMETTLLKRNGESILVEGNLSPQVRDGQVVATRSVLRDVTQRVAMEQAIRKSEQELRGAFDGAPIGMAVVALDGRWLQVNDALCEMLGYDEGAFLSTTYRAVVHPDDYSDEEEIVGQLARGDIKSYQWEKRFVHARGGIVWTLVSASLVRDPVTGEPFYYIVQIMDFTERKRIEAELAVARDVAVTTARQRTEFLANMSHEIRTPMNGIVGMVSLLQRTHLDVEQRSYVETIDASGRALITVINEILDFSKIDAGKLVLESVPTDLVALTESIGLLFSESARSKGLRLTTSAAATVPKTLFADPVRVRQVLTNLIDNALKFTEQGEVHVSVARHDTPSPAIRFDVTDTGIGINPLHLARMFEPFVQADGSTMRRYGGTGLGLTICKRLAEAMGGSLTAESVPGQGSRFTFMLPLHEDDTAGVEEQQPPAVVAGSSDAVRSLRILVAEDNEINQKVTLGQLKMLGYAADIVANGREAVEAVMAGGYDAVLMDCQMPEMDGYEASREIRRREKPGQRIAIIAVTANALEGSRAQFLAAGIDEHIVKPVEYAHLKQVLESVFDGTARNRQAHERGGALDSAAISSLRDLTPDGSASLLRQLVHDFAREAPQRMSEMRSAIITGDVASSAALAHKLSGSCSVLGASKLALEFAGIEVRCRNAAADSCVSQLDDIEYDLAEVIRELRREIGEK